MTIEKITESEKIRTHKQISVAFILLPFVFLLWQWSRIDDLICKIFLYTITIAFCRFAAYMIHRYYDEQIDEFFKAGE